MNNEAKIAVLTGDFINSQADETALKQAMQLLEQSAERFAVSRGLDLRLTRFRGDGWQVVITDPTHALAALVFIHAELTAAKALATRIALGFGPAHSLGSTSLADASGPAFVASGHALDDMPNKRQFIVIGAENQLQTATLELLEHVVLRWTAKQADAMRHAILNPDQSHGEIAQTLGLTRQAAQARLSAAGHQAILRVLYAFARNG